MFYSLKHLFTDYLPPSYENKALQHLSLVRTVIYKSFLHLNSAFPTESLIDWSMLSSILGYKTAPVFRFRSAIEICERTTEELAAEYSATRNLHKLKQNFYCRNTQNCHACHILKIEVSLLYPTTKVFQDPKAWHCPLIQQKWTAHHRLPITSELE